MKKFVRYFSVLPALLILFLIFGFSAQDGETSGSLSLRLCGTVLRSANRLLSLGLTELELWARADSIHFGVRKAAHMTEYFFLTMGIFFPLWIRFLTGAAGSSRKSTFYKILLLTFFLSVVCASLDEFHQVFVPGRSGSPADVLIDSVGICAACGILFLFRPRTNLSKSTVPAIDKNAHGGQQTNNP